MREPIIPLLPFVTFCGPRRRTGRSALFGRWDAHRVTGVPLRLVLTGVRERYGVRSTNEESRDPHRVVGG